MRQQIGMEARVAAVMMLNTTEFEFGPMNLTPKSPRSVVWIAPNRSQLVAVHLKQECFNSMLMLRLRKDIPMPLNRVREPSPPPNIKDVDGLRLEGGGAAFWDDELRLSLILWFIGLVRSPRNFKRKPCFFVYANALIRFPFVIDVLIEQCSNVFIISL